MHMDALLWLFLPVFVAGGSALLSYYIMQAKMEVALAKERESLAEARATITSQKVTMEERIKATEESTKRLAMDDFMQDFRVEERSYARESRSLTALRKSMVMQERLFFRNIPLSNWIEHEMLVEEGRDLDQLPKESVFTTSTVASSLGGASGANGSGVLSSVVSSLEVSENRLPSSALPISSLPISALLVSRVPISKTLDEFDVPAPKPVRENVSLIHARAVAFGAQ
jgi:hypothetical protein